MTEIKSLVQISSDKTVQREKAQKKGRSAHPKKNDRCARKETERKTEKQERLTVKEIFGG